MKQTAGGRFNPREGPIYFIVQSPGSVEIAAEIHPWILCALNIINATGTGGRLKIEQTLDNPDIETFIDSGVFDLVQKARKKLNVPWSDMLNTKPSEVPGWDKLWNKYTELCPLLEDRCWGYVELDLGGWIEKRKTRAKLEDLGLRPIPVYHPIVDPYEYGYELAETYDRIAIGNLAKTTDPEMYHRIMGLVSDLRLRYPDLWIHLLGHGISEMLIASDANSVDASSWNAGIRYGRGASDRAGTRAAGMLDVNWVYARDATPESGRTMNDALRLAAAVARGQVENWRYIRRAYEDLGLLDKREYRHALPGGHDAVPVERARPVH